MGKKQTIRNQIDQDIEISENQRYARTLGPRGNHQHEVEFADSTKTLVTLPPRFRNLVWIKRGYFVVVDATTGTVSEKVGGEIAHVLYPKDIKHLKAAGKWPAEFDDKKSENKLEHSDEEEEEEDDDDDLFKNNNRPLERASSQYDPLKELNDQFSAEDKGYTNQYASIYYLRLNKLQIPCYVSRVLDTQPNELCYMVGTVYLQMPKKPYVMDDLEDDDAIVNPVTPEKYRSDDDVISLEDESGRVEILGKCLSKQFLVTGMIVGILGKETASGAFEVVDICLPGVAKQQPLSNMEEFLTGELDPELSRNITRVILAGNSTSKPKSNEKVSILDAYLDEICSTIDVDIMPGATDPSQRHLPQPRMPPPMLRNAHSLSTFNSVSNPHWCKIDNVVFLGTSGQNVDDIYKYVDGEDRLKMAESCMYWRHIAPSAPDTLWCYPFKDRDPFVLEECPHVYFIGNQPEFDDGLLLGAEGQQIRTILLPSFAKTGTVALLNLSTLECKTHLSEKEETQNAEKPKYKATGPWQVHVAAALPLRSMSRLWGAFNSLTIPTPLRPAGFKLYSWIFGCNLDEMKNPNLYDYPNLSAFFYRELKDGARPIAKDAPLVSPADGKILHYGIVQGKDIEQIKGITYNLDALLGTGEQPAFPVTNAVLGDSDQIIVDEKEFANVNGIAYSLDDMLAEGTEHHSVKTESAVGEDAVAEGHQAEPKDERALAKLAKVDSTTHIKSGNALFFCVVYLAPGDYHRFHSPTNWVVETRRHFAGELFSVSPYFAKLLENLFVLNERVTLLGKWKHGFFSMIPVGATNVGSIKINFDEALKTNQKEDIPLGTYTEATYKSASKLLGGKPLQFGDEMGGFYLGSTVVLVFEAPQSFKFNVTSGQKVKMGEPLGNFEKQ
ncbi:phosphatidylserine decarboxylase-domain-containing protein [Sporodiniella umbellata]|nr:phosphatidylserine decarboxylase-domain-containing protein [Sporodiniella umbellata]